MAIKNLDELIGKVLKDTYKIKKRLGGGGMGAIFEASHLRLSRRFAVKVLLPALTINPEALARFRQEAEITSALENRHIIEIIDFDKMSDGLQYMVMELLEGEDLAHRLEKVGVLDPNLIRSIMRQATFALAAAHESERSVIHRDLKPENIFLCRDGDSVKILDFGISKIREGAEVKKGEHSLTKASTVLGSPYYLSPEQASGDSANIDQRSDIFSLGVCLYLMLTGELPFPVQEEETMSDVLRRICVAEPLPVRDHTGCSWITPEISEVVYQALQKKPGDRFATMREFGEAFETAVIGQEEAETQVEFQLPLDGTPIPREDEPGLSTLPGIGLRNPRQVIGNTIADYMSEPFCAADTTRTETDEPPPTTDTLSVPVKPYHKTMVIIAAVAVVALVGSAILLGLGTLADEGSGQKVVRPRLPATVKVKLPAQPKPTPDAKVVVTAIKQDFRPDSKVMVAVRIPTKQVRPKVEPKRQTRPKPKVKRKVRRPKPVPVPAKKAFGSLRVATMKGSDPFGGAKVYLITRSGKRYLGTTPLRLKRVEMGTYQVEVKHGSVTKRRKVTIGAKTRIIIEF